MKRILSPLLILLLLGACATTYTHPAKNAADFEKDRQECEVIARKTLAAKGVT